MSHTPEPCKRCGIYASLVRALDGQLSHHRAQAAKYREAVATLESERKANKLLTAQIADMEINLTLARELLATKESAEQQRDKLLAALDSKPQSPVPLTEAEFRVFKLGWLECRAAAKAAIAEGRGDK